MDIYDMLKLWCPAQLVIGCRNSGGPPPFLTAHSTGVDCIFTLLLPCETFAESSEQLHSAWGITEPFVLGDEMTESSGLVRLLKSRSQHGSWARLGLSEVTKGTIVPFDPSAFSATEHLLLPLSARMQNNKTFHFLPKQGFYNIFYMKKKQVFDCTGGKG